MNSLSIIWDFDPVMLSIGSFDILYYSVSWMLAFIVGTYIFAKMLEKDGKDKSLNDAIFLYAFISCIVGARLGHCLFYDFDYYTSNPFQILNLREGGLASHGAAFGMLVGLYMFTVRYRLKYIWTLDRATTVIPLSGAFIRLGNLANSEIYGTPTDAPWGFIFALRGETIAMHPTQIYEAIIYASLSAFLIYLFFKKDIGTKRPGMLFGLFLIGTFGSRIFIEAIKQPQEAFEAAMTLNMGQILSIPFTLLGLFFVVKAMLKRA